MASAVSGHACPYIATFNYTSVLSVVQYAYDMTCGNEDIGKYVQETCQIPIAVTKPFVGEQQMFSSLLYKSM